MKTEIERKFLVNKEKWNLIQKDSGTFFRQGYIITDPEKTIRIRITNTKAFLTIKGITVGATRLEYEYEIPLKDAEELLNNFTSSELSKIRYEILFGNKKWEVDEFLGDNAGLLVAEIELKKEDEDFEIPSWIEKDVTGETKYYNSNLIENPFKKWNK